MPFSESNEFAKLLFHTYFGEYLLVMDADYGFFANLSTTKSLETHRRNGTVIKLIQLNL